MNSNVQLYQKINRPNTTKQLHEGDYEEAFNLFEITSRAGENIGIGEIPTLEFFRTMMQKAVAVGTYNDANVLESVIIVKPYHVVRHVSPVVCQILLATRQHPVSEDHLRQLFRVGCELAEREDCGGYSGCIVEVFAYCLKHLQVLTEEGFHVTCTVPHAGLLSGHEGYVMSYCLYKELKAAESSSYTTSLIVNRTTQFEAKDNFKPTLLTSEKLVPLQRTTSGLKTTTRHLRPDELPICYKAFSDAVDLGYGVNEIPTYAKFLRKIVDNAYNFVVEECETKTIYAYFSIGPSSRTRCRTRNVLNTVNFVLLPQYRSKKLSGVITSSLSYIAAACGYKAIATSTAITNVPAVRISRDFGSIHGVLPKGIYLTKTGWTDVVVICSVLSEILPESNLQYINELEQYFH